MRARRWREAAGLSRRQVAARIGRSYDSVLLYEQGRVTPPDEVLRRYARAVGVEVTHLLFDAPERASVAHGREPTDTGRGPYVHDPCEPVLVPGGAGKHIVCGRVRTPKGQHLLDTGGGSG